MHRHFNTAVPRDPADHYMLPPEQRLPVVRALVDQKAYFVLHAPRHLPRDQRRKVAQLPERSKRERMTTEGGRQVELVRL